MKTKHIFLVVLVIGILFVGFIVACEARFKEPEMVEQEYTVAAGETLWDIAHSYCPKKMDLRDWIAKVAEENRIGQDRIQAGQTITIFVEE